MENKKIWTVAFYAVTVAAETRMSALEKAKQAIADGKGEVNYANEGTLVE